MREILVKDNYLDIEDFEVIRDTMSTDMFPWFFNEEKIYKVTENNLFNYQFTHTFYHEDERKSHHFNILHPLLEKMEPKKLIRIKANLNPISHKLIEFESHIDQEYECNGAIYYINGNNGYTRFGDEKIQSKENRIVFFGAEMIRTGTNSTDCKNRMVINFNYF